MQTKEPYVEYEPRLVSFNLPFQCRAADVIPSVVNETLHLLDSVEHYNSCCRVFRNAIRSSHSGVLACTCCTEGTLLLGFLMRWWQSSENIVTALDGTKRGTKLRINIVHLIPSRMNIHMRMVHRRH